MFQRDYNHNFISKLIQSIVAGETWLEPCMESNVMLDLLQIWLKLTNSVEEELSNTFQDYYQSLEKEILCFVITGRYFGWLESMQGISKDHPTSNQYCLNIKSLKEYGFKRKGDAK